MKNFRKYTWYCLLCLLLPLALLMGCGGGSGSTEAAAPDSTFSDYATDSSLWETDSDLLILESYSESGPEGVWSIEESLPSDAESDLWSIPLLPESDTYSFVTPEGTDETASFDIDPAVYPEDTDSWYTDSEGEELPSESLNGVSVTVVEDGTYTSRDEVAAYIHQFGKLPSNYITKKEAEKLGWVSSKGNLWKVAPGMSIGGSRFNNYEGILPDGSYKECDIDYAGGYRNSKRLIYSTDGRIYYTEDHYTTFEQLYG